MPRVRNCCLEQDRGSEACWTKEFTAEKCCRCLGLVLGAVASYKEAADKFLDFLSIDPAELAEVRRQFMKAEHYFLRLRSPEVWRRYTSTFYRWIEMSWRAMGALNTLFGPDPEGTERAKLVSQLCVEQRKRVQLAQQPAESCVINTFTRDCVGQPAQVFRRLPPVAGPPRKGDILDFLGVSTDFTYFCDGQQAILAGHAPSRVHECLAHERGILLRQWPSMDEEYLEWVDVLGAAAAAADRGDHFAMAEVGAGTYGIWAVRAAVAFSRLAGDRGKCTLLMIEPLEPNRSMLRRHIRMNVPPGRCSFVDSRDFVEDLASFIALLDRTNMHGKVWDLVDVDIQGYEMHLLAGNLDLLASRVRRLHLSTHSDLIHEAMLQRLREAGWTVPAAFWPLSVASFGAHGGFAVMDGHLTAFPPQRAEAWHFWW